MEGYELVTSEGKRWGHVVGTSGDNVIVEHGRLRKTRFAVPQTFVTVDDDERVVRTTLSAHLIEESPTVHDDHVDESAVAAYYGLAGGYEEPGTQGYGVLNEDDPGRTSDQEALAADVEPAEAERARIRGDLTGGDTYGSPGRPLIPPDPHTAGRSGDER